MFSIQYVFPAAAAAAAAVIISSMVVFRSMHKIKFDSFEGGGGTTSKANLEEIGRVEVKWIVTNYGGKYCLAYMLLIFSVIVRQCITKTRITWVFYI
jgi:hypothetical protein